MLIEGESRTDSELLHRDERDAVRQRVTFILMALKISPSFLEQGLVNANQLNGRAIQESATNLNRLLVETPSIEEGHYLIKNVGGRDESWKRHTHTLPMA